MGRRRRRQKLPEGSFPASIEALSHDGRGIARIDGKTVFLHGALPGEEVRFHYSYRSKKHDEGIVDSIDKASGQRATPVCDHFGICGGCSLQHMRNDDQIAYKQQALIDALQRIGHVTAEKVMPPLSSSSTGYRRKARLGVKYVIKKEKVLIGFRERGTSFIADIQSCPVLHPAIGEKLRPLADLIETFSIRDKIPQIEVAMGDEKVVLIFRLLEPLLENEALALEQFCQQHDLVPYIQEGGPQTVMPLSGDAVTLRYALPDEALQFEFLPTDFTQVNTEINRKMITQAMNWLAPQSHEQILDLFCGLGNFTLPLAKRCQHVIGVEGDTDLVDRARQNAFSNGLDNVEFHVANLYEPVSEMSWMKQHYDAILLDPPRSGAEEMMPLLGKLGAKRILYVSCYPGTLARDAGMLVNEYGFRLVKAGVMDMFPHTAHVESMALFEKK